MLNYQRVSSSFSRTLLKKKTSKTSAKNKRRRCLQNSFPAIIQTYSHARKGAGMVIGPLKRFKQVKQVLPVPSANDQRKYPHVQVSKWVCLKNGVYVKMTILMYKKKKIDLWIQGLSLKVPDKPT